MSALHRLYLLFQESGAGVPQYTCDKHEDGMFIANITLSFTSGETITCSGRGSSVKNAREEAAVEAMRAIGKHDAPLCATATVAGAAYNNARQKVEQIARMNSYIVRMSPHTCTGPAHAPCFAASVVLFEANGVDKLMEVSASARTKKGTCDDDDDVFATLSFVHLSLLTEAETLAYSRILDKLVSGHDDDGDVPSSTAAAAAPPPPPSAPAVVEINAGGHLYDIGAMTWVCLQPHLPTPLVHDKSGRIFIDCNGRLFEHVLTRLRTGVAIRPTMVAAHDFELLQLEFEKFGIRQ